MSLGGVASEQQPFPPDIPPRVQDEWKTRERTSCEISVALRRAYTRRHKQGVARIDFGRWRPPVRSSLRASVCRLPFTTPRCAAVSPRIFQIVKKIKAPLSGRGSPVSRSLSHGSTVERLQHAPLRADSPQDPYRERLDRSSLLSRGRPAMIEKAFSLHQVPSSAFGFTARCGPSQGRHYAALGQRRA